MSETNVDGIILEIEATTDKADKGLNSTIESLRAMKKILDGVDAKKLKSALEPVEEFQKRLQGAFRNIKVSGNMEELTKQIQAAEARFDALLEKENKLQFIGGVNENSKAFRGLQYDLEKVCSELDALYAAREKLESEKPLNFWQKPGWADNLRKFGTTDEAIIRLKIDDSEFKQELEYLSEEFSDTVKNAQPMADAIKNSFKDVNTESKKVDSVFSRLKDALASMRESFKHSGTDKFNADMQALIDGMNQAKYTMKQMETGNVGFNATVYERAAIELSKAQLQMQKYKAALAANSAEGSKMSKVLSGLGSAARGTVEALKKAGAGIESVMKAASRATSDLKNKFSWIEKKFATVFRLSAFMLLRRAISKIFEKIKAGFDNLVSYSQEKGTQFSNNVSELRGNLSTLGNQIVASYEPLINSITPILDSLISKLVAAASAVTQFASAMSGASVWTKAKKQVDAYGKSVDGASKAMRGLAAIDELNVLSSQEKSGSSAGNGGLSFEEAEIDPRYFDFREKIMEMWEQADFYDLGTLIAGKINSALARIDWTVIKDTAARLGRSLASFLNGIIADTDFELIGNSFAEALNSAINFVYEFVSTFDFKKFGESIGNAFTAAINGIEWNKAGQTLGKFVTGMFDTLKGFIDKTDWKGLGKGVVNAIGGFFKELNWGSVSSGISSAVKALLDLLTGTIQGIDWSEVPGYIVKSISDFFANFDWPGMAQSLGQLLGSAVKAAIDLAGSIWEMIKEAWGDLTDYFSEYIEAAGGNIIAGLWNGIVDALKNVESWLRENVFNPFIDGFKSAFGIASPSKEMKILGRYIVEGLIEGILAKFSDCKKKVEDWAKKVVEWFKKGEDGKGIVENFKTTAGNIISGFRNKIGSDYTNAKDKVQKFAGSVKSWFEKPNGSETLVSSFTGIGSNIIQGFLDGVSSLWDSAMSKIREFGQKIISAGKEGTDEHSPSRAFRQIGAYVVDGFNIGLDSEGKKTKEVMNSWIQSSSDMDINIGSRIKVDDSALRNMRPNYGSDFTNDVIVQKVRQEVASQGTIQTALKFAEMDRLATAITTAGETEAMLLRDAVDRLDEIADKEFGITDREIASSIRRSNYEHFMRTGKPLLQN